jgi:hypothetical protein
MKKVLIGILLLSYGFASSGASIDLHYCMGRLISWDIDYSSKNDCQKCGMKTKPDKGCCDNKQIHPKVDKEQQVVFNDVSFHSNLLAIVPKNLQLFFHSSVAISNPLLHSPPVLNSYTLYLFNCNFRI